MIALTWIAGVVAVLGVGGAIAAAVLFPAVAIPLIQSIVARIIACKPCLYALAIIGLCFGSWWFGHHQAVLDCRADTIAAELRNARLDADNAKKSEIDQTERANTIEAQSNDQHAKDQEYIKSLEARPSCNLDDDDLIGVHPRKSRPRFTKPAAGAK
ncbi:hypothetical protein V1281_002573 [Nitrobacteraceae bacterium AZCC 2161]